MGRWLLMNLHLSPATPTVTPSVSPLSFRPRAEWHQEAPAATQSPTPCSNLIPAPPLPHWSPTSASPATQLCIQRLPSCCHRNPPQRHFCFSLFPPPPSHPPPWCLLSTPPWGGGGTPYPQDVLSARRPPGIGWDCGCQDPPGPRCSTWAPTAGHVPLYVTKSGRRWPTPVPVPQVLYGVLVSGGAMGHRGERGCF